jgi:hypothetical protein
MSWNNLSRMSWNLTLKPAPLCNTVGPGVGPLGLHFVSLAAIDPVFTVFLPVLFAALFRFFPLFPTVAHPIQCKG